MAAVVESFQDAILMNKPPMFYDLNVIFLISMFILVIGLFLYKKAAPEMVDVL